MNNEESRATKAELLKYCRYYKGENECPDELRKKGFHAVWQCESDWVAEEVGEKPQGFNIFYPEIEDGTVPTPQIEGKDTPNNLLKVLFHRCCYYQSVTPDEIAGQRAKEGFLYFLRKHYYREL